MISLATAPASVPSERDLLYIAWGAAAMALLTESGGVGGLVGQVTSGTDSVFGQPGAEGLVGAIVDAKPEGHAALPASCSPWHRRPHQRS